MILHCMIISRQDFLLFASCSIPGRRFVHAAIGENAVFRLSSHPLATAIYGNIRL